MVSVEVYYYGRKIKAFKDVSERSIEGIVDFIVHTVNTLVGSNGVVLVKNKPVNSTEMLRKLISKAINRGENVKVEIKTIIPIEGVREGLETDISRQIISFHTVPFFRIC